MFYLWHTSLVVLFIAVAYWFGYQFGLKKKIKVFSQKKLWKVLKSTPKEEVAISTVSPNETSQEDWIKGYNKWKSKKR